MLNVEGTVKVVNATLENAGLENMRIKIWQALNG